MLLVPIPYSVGGLKDVLGCAFFRVRSIENVAKPSTPAL